jgi:hypothetical protein
MLTTKDIKNLVEVLKDEFVTKREFFELDSKVDRMITNVDLYAKKVEVYYQEMMALNHRVTRVEKKIGLK